MRYRAFSFYLSIRPTTHTIPMPSLALNSGHAPNSGHALNPRHAPPPRSMSVALCSMKPHNGTDYLQFYETSQYVTGLILYPIICIYGLVGNCLILAVLSRKSMQSSTNIYLSALAVSDTLKLVNDLLYSLTVLLTHLARPHGQRMFRLLYPNSHFISNMSASVSSWLTVSVAVERFLLVCHPTRSVTLVTRSRAICIAVACYVLMTAVAVPSAFRYQVSWAWLGGVARGVMRGRG